MRKVVCPKSTRALLDCRVKPGKDGEVGAPRMANSKSAYDRLFLTRFGCRERRSQLRVFIATRTGEAIIEVNPG